jgi:hypothetical protein
MAQDFKKFRQWFKDACTSIIRFILRLPLLVGQGMLFTAISFIISTALIVIGTALLNKLGLVTPGWLEETYPKWRDALESITQGESAAPIIDTLKECFNTPTCRLVSTTSAAIGAAATTYVATKKELKETVTQAMNEAMTCDESWDVENFLAELTVAMKGGHEAPRQYMARARHLLDVWKTYKSVFDPLVKDYNGDFARLAILVNGDSVPNCNKKEEADGYIKQEIWYILDRISKTADCRRYAIVSALRNLLDKIGVIDQAAIIKRHNLQPDYLSLIAIGFGLGLFILIIYILLH